MAVGKSGPDAALDSNLHNANALATAIFFCKIYNLVLRRGRLSDRSGFLSPDGVFLSDRGDFLSPDAGFLSDRDDFLSPDANIR
jgi:hypothetical protein